MGLSCSHAIDLDIHAHLHPLGTSHQVLNDNFCRNIQRSYYSVHIVPNDELQ